MARTSSTITSTTTPPAPEPPSRAAQRKQRLLELENEQRIEDAEALKFTDEQKLSLFLSFRSVKFEWSDLDGMRPTRSVRRRYNSSCPASPPAVSVAPQTHSLFPARPPALAHPPASPALAVLTNAHLASFGKDDTICVRRPSIPPPSVTSPSLSSLYRHPHPQPPPEYTSFPQYGYGYNTGEWGGDRNQDHEHLTLPSTPPRLPRSLSSPPGVPLRTSPTLAPPALTTPSIAFPCLTSPISPPALSPPTLATVAATARAPSPRRSSPRTRRKSSSSHSKLLASRPASHQQQSPIRVPLPPLLVSSPAGDDDEDAWVDEEGDGEGDTTILGVNPNEERVAEEPPTPVPASVWRFGDDGPRSPPALRVVVTDFGNGAGMDVDGDVDSGSDSGGGDGDESDEDDGLEPQTPRPYSYLSSGGYEERCEERYAPLPWVEVDLMEVRGGEKVGGKRKR
ncbi:hypothetical protein R3P38DRAFT_2843388 [Favolaschia claudopus]|uniref:Uncharacterized protein n=1 Tax=Favolaschia claudopus TaxID=2862362 RepID=A0AAW0E291_9AGAR